MEWVKVGKTWRVMLCPGVFKKCLVCGRILQYRRREGKPTHSRCSPNSQGPTGGSVAYRRRSEVDRLVNGLQMIEEESDDFEQPVDGE